MPLPQTLTCLTSTCLPLLKISIHGYLNLPELNCVFCTIVVGGYSYRQHRNHTLVTTRGSTQDQRRSQGIACSHSPWPWRQNANTNRTTKAKKRVLSIPIPHSLTGPASDSRRLGRIFFFGPTFDLVSGYEAKSLDCNTYAHAQCHTLCVLRPLRRAW